MEPPLPLLAVEVRPRAAGGGAPRAGRAGGCPSGAAATVELPAGALEVSLTRAERRSTRRRSAARCAPCSSGWARSRAATCRSSCPTRRCALALVPAEGLARAAAPTRRRRSASGSTRRCPFDVRAARLAWAPPRRGAGAGGGRPRRGGAGLRGGARVARLPARARRGRRASPSLVGGGGGAGRPAARELGRGLRVVRPHARRPAAPPADAARRRGARTRSRATPTSTMQFHRDRLGGAALAEVVVRSAAVPGDEAAALLERALEAAAAPPPAVGGPRDRGGGRRGPGGGGSRGVRPAEGGVSAPLNLARRPFRNERLPTLVLAVGLRGPRRRPPCATRSWRATCCPGARATSRARWWRSRRRSRDLRAESAELRRLEASPEALKEWAAVKEPRGPAGVLLDRPLRRARGGAAAGGEARLGRARRRRPGGPSCRSRAVGRAREDALALLQALQAHEDFEGAFLNGWTEGREGVDISCTVRYVPKARRPEGRPVSARSRTASGGRAAAARLPRRCLGVNLVAFAAWTRAPVLAPAQRRGARRGGAGRGRAPARGGRGPARAGRGHPRATAADVRAVLPRAGRHREGGPPAHPGGDRGHGARARASSPGRGASGARRSRTRGWSAWR